jgi:phage replication O-like protein O
MRSTPQLEDGHIRIANELYDRILDFGFKGHELKVLLAVIRKTYGYQKKEDDISASQLGTMCKIGRQHVTSALNSLALRNVINKRPGRFGSIVGVQKNYRLWVNDERLKSLPSPESGQGSPQSEELPVDAAPVQIPDTCPDSGRVQEPDTCSPEIGQVDSPDSGHTKDNLPKDNPIKTNSCAPQANRESESKTSAGRQGRAKTGSSNDLQSHFERFYAAYPLKKSRGKAEREFAKLRPDEELLTQMLAGLEQRKASGTWIDPKFIPYPASWLNAKGWLDELQTEYSPAERDVIEKFNGALGDVAGVVSMAIFVPARAAAIREFVTFSEKPGFVERFFPWVREKVTMPPSAGFDWMISRKGFADVSSGQHNRKAA